MLKRKLLYTLLTLFLYWTGVQGKDYSIMDFGAKPDGVTLNTHTIQYAIDYVHTAGGGKLIFDAGNYLTGTIYLKSNVTLHLAQGAVLLGSYNALDYKKDEYIQRTALLFAVRQDNIGITGEGTINGRGFIVANNLISYIQRGLIDDPLHMDRPDEINRPHNIYFRECRNVRVEGVRMHDPASWNQAYDQCRQVIIDNINVDCKSYWNNDGIDIVDCDSVRISNSFFDAADDGICFKSHEPSQICQNVVVDNCIIRSSASGLKFGTASKGGFRDFIIKNLTIYNTYRSAVTFATVDGGIIENILVDSVRAVNVGNAFYLRIGDRWNSGRRPLMKNVTLSNFNVKLASSKPDAGYSYEGPVEHLPRNISPASIIGLPEDRIQGIILKNIDIESPGGGNPFYAKCGVTAKELEGIPEMRTTYPEFSQFKELPAWGIFIRHADDIRLDNVKLKVHTFDYRPAIVTSDVKGVILEKVDVQSTLNDKKEQLFMYKTFNVIQ